MVVLDSARRITPVPALARWLLGLGIAATLAANVAHGLGHGLSAMATRAQLSSPAAMQSMTTLTTNPRRKRPLAFHRQLVYPSLVAA